jgi:hypothetical protein
LVHGGSGGDCLGQRGRLPKVGLRINAMGERVENAWIRVILKRKAQSAPKNVL